MDVSRLKTAAKTSFERGTNRIRRWWSKKYNRPPNDPLFEEKSISEHLQEFYEDLMAQRSELQEELKQGVGQSQVSDIMRAITQIDKILGDETEEEDPLVAEWEAALERGEEPDI